MIDPAAAKQRGFATYNGGPHLCVELPPGHSTISVKTQGGKLITVSFCKGVDTDEPQCVDIKQHSAPDEDGKPMPLDCSVRGKGPLLFAVNRKGEQPMIDHDNIEPATLMILNLA